MHDGVDWLYVVSGRLRLTLRNRTFVLAPGDAAEYDAGQPHQSDPTTAPADVLPFLGPAGERSHLQNAR
ncbi:cupin domain-containing protein [Streptomyces sp. NPDC102437]|uniref:cupin domain-containing protein n=1 Tax=Streptomyces sp. NPDC102437 TaxID=3366175 RepID=UPI0038127FAB